MKTNWKTIANEAPSEWGWEWYDMPERGIVRGIYSQEHSNVMLYGGEVIKVNGETKWHDEIVPQRN